jgi:hypothetical protein
MSAPLHLSTRASLPAEADCLHMPAHLCLLMRLLCEQGKPVRASQTASCLITLQDLLATGHGHVRVPALFKAGQRCQPLRAWSRHRMSGDQVEAASACQLLRA